MFARARGPNGLRVQPRLRLSQPSQLEPIDGKASGETRDDLHREHAHRLSWSLREPSQCEVHHYWWLSSHEKLPEMGCGSLVGFMHNAEYCNVTHH
jgi:hypothetical protein